MDDTSNSENLRKKIPDDSGFDEPCELCGQEHPTHDLTITRIALLFIISPVVLGALIILALFILIVAFGKHNFINELIGFTFWVTLVFHVLTILFLFVHDIVIRGFLFRLCPVKKALYPYDPDAASMRDPKKWEEIFYKLYSPLLSLESSPACHLAELLLRCLLVVGILIAAPAVAKIALIIGIGAAGWFLYAHNRRTFTAFTSSHKLARFLAALRTTFFLGVVLVVMLIPAILIKSVFDYYLVSAIDSLDTRISTVHGVAVPSLIKDQYPLYSPLRWAGIPRYSFARKELSLEQPVAGSRIILRCAKFLLESLMLATSLILYAYYFRALVTILSRQLISRGLRISYYIPHSKVKKYVSPNNASELLSTTSPMLGDSLSTRLHLTSGVGSHVYLRRDLSPSGGTPWVEAPQADKAVYSRVSSGTFLMHRYAMSELPVTVFASEGHRFASIKLTANDEVILSYRNLIGWTDSIKIKNTLSLQLGGIALGRWIVHRAAGPGTVYFDVCGDAEIQTIGESLSFEVERLLAFDSNSVFIPAANPGWLDTLMGVVTISAKDARRCLLDSRGDHKSRSRSIFGVLIRAYSFR